MIDHTLIGPRRCFCGAVIFHVAKCPMCGERADNCPRAAMFAPAVKPQPLPQSDMSKKVQAGIARDKQMKSSARQAVEQIRAARKAAQ